MRVVFRYDDFSAARRLSFDIDQAVFDEFGAANVPLLVGVTPRMAENVHDPDETETARLEDDPQRIALLSRYMARGWQLALHGLSHRRSKVSSRNEFSGVRASVQREKIRAGVSVLDACFPGASVDIFIPPWNRYDGNTEKALAENGFKVVCGGPMEPYQAVSGIACIPSYFDLDTLLKYTRAYSFEDLMATVGEADLVVTLHEYDFQSPGSSKPSLGQLREVFGLLREHDVQGATLSFGPDRYRPLHVELLLAKLRLLSRQDFPSRAALRVLAGNRRGHGRPLGSTMLVALTGGKRLYKGLRARMRPLRHAAIAAREITKALLHSGGGRRLYNCNICGHTGPFVEFAAPGNVKRPFARCVRCNSLERHRFMSFVLERELAASRLEGLALIIAPDQVARVIRRRFAEVISADLAAPEVSVKLDLQHNPFRDACFALVMANHVFDEIENDRKAIADTYRALRPGGWLIAPVPRLRDSTLELDERRPDGKIRLAGSDYDERLLEAGFALKGRFRADQFAEAAREHQFFVFGADGTADAETLAIWEKPGTIS